MARPSATLVKHWLLQLLLQPLPLRSCVRRERRPDVAEQLENFSIRCNRSICRGIGAPTRLRRLLLFVCQFAPLQLRASAAALVRSCCRSTHSPAPRSICRTRFLSLYSQTSVPSDSELSLDGHACDADAFCKAIRSTGLGLSVCGGCASFIRRNDRKCRRAQFAPVSSQQTGGPELYAGTSC